MFSVLETEWSKEKKKKSKENEQKIAESKEQRSKLPDILSFLPFCTIYDLLVWLTSHKLFSLSASWRQFD